MSDSVLPSTVVKVGGSLLDWPELPGCLAEFLGTQLGDEARIVLIVGGGRVVDAIRELDRVHRFGEVQAHLLAIHALELTAEIVCRLLPGSRVVPDVSGLQECWDAGAIPILAPGRFLLASKDSVDLPASWDVTSDSIAARIAARLNANRLVLLKSVDLTAGSSRSRAAAAGLVDPMFPEIARPIRRVDYRNLRDPAGELIAIPGDG